MTWGGWNSNFVINNKNCFYGFWNVWENPRIFTVHFKRRWNCIHQPFLEITSTLVPSTPTLRIFCRLKQKGSIGWVQHNKCFFRGPKLIESSVAARLNGYIGGYGTKVQFEFLILIVIISSRNSISRIGKNRSFPIFFSLISNNVH